MRNDKIISKHLQKCVGTFRHQTFTDVTSYLFHILSKLLVSFLRTNKFDEELYNKLYHDLEFLFYNDVIPVIDIIPLDKFESNVDVIDIDEDLCIRKIRQQEVERLIKEAENLSVAVSDIRDMKYVVEYKRNIKKICIEKANIKNLFLEYRLEDLIGNILSITDILIVNLITIMRLFKKGAVGYNFILSTPLLDTAIGNDSTSYFTPSRLAYGEKYILTKDEITYFQKLWKSIKDINFFSSKNKNQYLAVERFNSSYERARPEDKFLDFAISLEALLSKVGEGTDSATHKFAIRFSRLVNDDYDIRRCLYREIRKLYEKRSNIAHGGSMYHLDLERMESYVRMALQSYLKKNEKHAKIKHDIMIEELDFN
jgi:Apea-like HEPN